MKRPSSTDDPKPDDTVESETKKARPDRDETAGDLVAKITAGGSWSSVKPSIVPSRNTLRCTTESTLSTESRNPQNTKSESTERFSVACSEK